MFSDINTNRSPETASRHQTSAAAAGSIGSFYPHHSAGARFKLASHLVSQQSPSSSVADLRSRLLVDARSAFSCVRPTSRDHRDRQPEVVGACDVARPTTSTSTAAKPRIWCIADVATSPDCGRTRTRAGAPSSPSLSDKPLSTSVSANRV